MQIEAEELIKKFLINTESPFLDSINIVIVMKCIPTYITDFSASLLNLSILQDSLIAYKNKEEVDAFYYVDKKNAKRVQDIRQLISEQQEDLNQVVHIMDEVNSYVEKNNKIIEDFEAIWEEFKIKRDDD